MKWCPDMHRIRATYHAELGAVNMFDLHCASVPPPPWNDGSVCTRGVLVPPCRQWVRERIPHVGPFLLSAIRDSEATSPRRYGSLLMAREIAGRPAMPEIDATRCVYFSHANAQPWCDFQRPDPYVLFCNADHAKLVDGLQQAFGGGPDPALPQARLVA